MIKRSMHIKILMSFLIIVLNLEPEKLYSTFSIFQHEENSNIYVFTVRKVSVELESVDVYQVVEKKV